MRTVACFMLFVAINVLVGCTNTTGAAHGDTAPSLSISTAQHATAGTAPASAAPHLAQYKDAQTGVTFSYPDVWGTSAQSPGYLGGELPNDYSPPKAVVSFSPAGNLYEKTVLSSLVFTYAIKSAQTPAACSEGIQSGDGAPQSRPMTIRGTTFQEFTGGDAGMCHQQSSRIDVTYVPASHRCLAFERDFNTECYGAGDNKRHLTAEETKALQQHLDEIMQSVTIQQ